MNDAAATGANDDHAPPSVRHEYSSRLACEISPAVDAAEHQPQVAAGRRLARVGLVDPRLGRLAIGAGIETRDADQRRRPQLAFAILEDVEDGAVRQPFRRLAGEPLAAAQAVDAGRRSDPDRAVARARDRAHRLQARAQDPPAGAGPLEQVVARAEPDASRRDLERRDRRHRQPLGDADGAHGPIASFAVAVAVGHHDPAAVGEIDDGPRRQRAPAIRAGGDVDERDAVEALEMTALRVGFGGQHPGPAAARRVQDLDEPAARMHDGREGAAHGIEELGGGRPPAEEDAAIRHLDDAVGPGQSALAAERQREGTPHAVVPLQQLVVVLDEQVAVAGFEHRRRRARERGQFVRRAPQRRHVVRQTGGGGQPEAAVRVGHDVVQASGQFAGPADGTPAAVVGGDAELEPRLAAERRPPLAIGARPPGELPALAGRHRAQLPPPGVGAADQHVGRLPVACRPHGHEQAGGAAVDERARLHRAEAGRKRQAVADAEAAVGIDAHPFDAPVGRHPGAAATGRHQEADRPGQAVTDSGDLRLERAVADAAIEQAAAADDQHPIAVDGQEDPARRRHRGLARPEALGQRIRDPSPPFQPLHAEIDEIADAPLTQHRPEHAVAALPHGQVRARRRQVFHPVAVEDGDLADFAVADEQTARWAARRVEGPGLDETVGGGEEPPVGPIGGLREEGSGRPAEGGQHQHRASPAANAPASGRARVGWTIPPNPAVYPRRAPGRGSPRRLKGKGGRRSRGDAGGEESYGTATAGGGGACEASTAFSTRSSPGETSVSAWPVASARPVRPTRCT